jgi:hypothetical protein
VRGQRDVRPGSIVTRMFGTPAAMSDDAYRFVLPPYGFVEGFEVLFVETPMPNMDAGSPTIVRFSLEHANRRLTPPAQLIAHVRDAEWIE